MQVSAIHYSPVYRPAATVPHHQRRGYGRLRAFFNHDTRARHRHVDVGRSWLTQLPHTTGKKLFASFGSGAAS